MELITNSRLRAFRACQRLHYYQYEIGARPVVEAPALAFGTVVHAGLEQWYRSIAEERRNADRAFALMLAGAEASCAGRDFEAFEWQRIKSMLIGYHARWFGEVSSGEIDVLGVEQEFRAPLINPATGRASRTFEIGGKVDAVIRDHGIDRVVEHKTSSDDIAPGALYWQALRLDSQVSMYAVGAAALGYDADGCVYDVLGKPAIKPYRATPEDKRRYKADGTLYAKQRANDESDLDYGARCSKAIADSPERYYQRAVIVRLEEEINEYQRETWLAARAIRECQKLGVWQRNPAACRSYRRLCAYWDVCTGCADINDGSRYQTGVLHPELSRKTVEPKE